ncbi:MAG TPA: molybdopterin-synthase adenylyltransferase MoeB [Acidobacteriota bacterium]|nr:molybdopterin-synthase adenylyltransferase MoeB [Acidobacteriota bacterium]
MSERTAAEDAGGLSAGEVERYSRHLILPEVGMEGQKKLKQARVLCVGAGGLGSPLALYLAAAGVGRLGLVDFDVVDASNLQRQVLHGTSQVGRSKLESARQRLRDLNPEVEVVCHEMRLDSRNALEVMADYDLVADGTDNFPTRYLVNDACILTGKPNVYASVFRFEGQASVFGMPGGPCYRCIFPKPPDPGLVPSCAEGGVLGILPGLLGMIQATEAVKLILGRGQPLAGRLLLVDALAMRFREVKFKANPECPVCGQNPTVTELIDYQGFCGMSEQSEQHTPEVSVRDFKAELDAGKELFVLDVRNPHELDIAKLEATSAVIPLPELEGRVDELDRDKDIVVFCRSGARSADATEMLLERGFKRVRNLAGGILAWSDEIDPSITKY